MILDKASTVSLLIRIDLELANAEKTIADLKTQTKPVAPDNAIGRLSRMEAINSKSVAESALALAENKKSKLLIAKSKVDEPGFGICEDCQKNIPIGRLLLVPESTQCVGCIDFD